MAKHPEIERILDSYRRHRWRSKPVEAIHALLNQEPESTPLLISRLIKVGDEYAGLMLSAAEEHLHPDAYPPLLEKAIELLQDSEHPLARDFIENAFLRHGISLGPYLKELFLADHYFKHIYRYMAWRDGGTEQVSYLAGFLDDPKLRERAIGALLELRLPEAFARIPANTDAPSFHNVGFSREKTTFRQLYPKHIYHLQFQEDYTSYDHETWQESSDRPYRFGGELFGQHCATCGSLLHHLLTFPASDLIPDACTLHSLTLATCNHCLGWEPRVLFLPHDELGIPQSQAPAVPRIPELPCAPFEETTVALTPAPERYRWQEWTHEQNIHRLGGHPAWIQQPEFPECPRCQRTMTFLLQLNSRLPFVQPNPEELGVMEWGSGGIAYFFWCDSCRVSAGTWQCT